MNYMEHPDYDTVVDALAEGIRENKPLLKALGITIMLRDLPSWDIYEPLWDKMFTGLTSTWLYRFLFPGRYRRLYRAYNEAALALQQDLLVATLDKGKEVIEG